MDRPFDIVDVGGAPLADRPDDRHRVLTLLMRHDLVGLDLFDRNAGHRYDSAPVHGPYT